jgi:hypothetical protein
VTGAIFQGAVGDPATATAADFVDALAEAMTVSALVALAGALLAAFAIRAKGKAISPGGAEAGASPAMSPDREDRVPAASRP